MITLLNVMIFLVLLIAMGIAVTIIIIKSTRKDEELLDEDLILNFKSHKCNGRFLGVQKDWSKGKGGRVIIEMSPRDVNFKNIDKIDNEKIIAEPNKILSLTKGELSRERNIKFILPKDPSDFPESFKNTETGKMFMFWTALKNADTTEIGAFREGMRRQAKHIKALGAGEASVDRIGKIQELCDESLQAIIKGKSGDKPSFSSLPQQNYGGN